MLALMLLPMCNSFHAQPILLPLWPDGAPDFNGLTGPERPLDRGRVENITEPTLTVYLPSRPNGMAVVMCPGGGYTRLALGHEGHDMASWFNSQGIVFAVLKYRMPNRHAQIPLHDAEQAMRLMRAHAVSWGVDPGRIGIMGASAGGHLASTLATHAHDGETRPNFQILLYPVVTMGADTHPGSRLNLLGEEPSGSPAEQCFSNELQVDAACPPAFIALSADDTSVPPVGSLRYVEALLRHGVSASLHLYPTGGHGWGFRDDFIYKKQWTHELEQWLTNILRP